MAALERGLGRGLDALLNSSRADAETTSRDTNKLALTQLTPGQHQPRRSFDEGALAELAASIKNQGVVQPLIVRPKADSTPQVYEIVAGERRWRAAKLAGLTEVPVIITAYTDDEAMTVALVENLQREDLNPVEEALALQGIRDAYSLSQEELAAKLGKSRSAVANALRLLHLSDLILASLSENKISAGHARALLAISDEAVRLELHDIILDRGLSVRDVEAAADSWKRSGELPAALSGKSAKPKQGKSPKPLELRTLQNMLRDAGHNGAMLGGNLEKGRVSLPYTSRGELEFILSVLGVNTEELSLPDAEQQVEQSAAPALEESLPEADEALAAMQTLDFDSLESVGADSLDEVLPNSLPDSLADNLEVAPEEALEDSAAFAPESEALEDFADSGLPQDAPIGEEELGIDEAEAPAATDEADVEDEAGKISLDEAIEQATALSASPRARSKSQSE